MGLIVSPPQSPWLPSALSGKPLDQLVNQLKREGYRLPDDPVLIPSFIAGIDALRLVFSVSSNGRAPLAGGVRVPTLYQLYHTCAEDEFNEEYTRRIAERNRLVSEQAEGLEPEALALVESSVDLASGVSPEFRSLSSFDLSEGDVEPEQVVEAVASAVDTSALETISFDDLASIAGIEVSDAQLPPDTDTSSPVSDVLASFHPESVTPDSRASAFALGLLSGIKNYLMS